MTTPVDEADEWACRHDMPGIEIPKHVRENFDPETTTILDIGAGWGKYALQLPEYHVEGIDIFPPHERFAHRYANYYVGDICDFDFEWYDVLIMGDVFEHITVDRAQALLERIRPLCQQWYIAVPWHFPQDEMEGNPHEKHEQDDLSAEIMMERYQVTPLVLDSTKGVFLK